ncbi:MAG TPA: ATP-binding protein [Bryobacteraceae bacterium]|nr:ATP-binding protein [Bryobacteraceae bacterium]
MKAAPNLMPSVLKRVFPANAVVPILRGSLILAVLTAAAYRLHLNAAAAGFVYVTATVLNCLDSGAVAAAVVSVLAVGCLDFFFITPRFHFTVADPVDVVALIAFLTTSLVITGLASKGRETAAAARRERQNLELLYRLGQRLLALDPLQGGHASILETLRRVLDLKGACMFDAATAHLDAVGESRLLRDRTRDAYIMDKEATEPEHGLALRCIRTAGRATGALGLFGLEDPERMAGPVAALTAVALGREQAVRNAAHAAAEAAAETLRSAILDALAHEFKTPLATILTAAGGLLEIGRLAPEQADLAQIVETEAGRLSHLTSRLLRMARLESEEIRPRLETADMAALVSAGVDRCARQSPEREIRLSVREPLPEIAADPDLLQLALIQLLENACQYAPPASPVKVLVEPIDGMVSVTVSNRGGPINAAERRLIFERFYRGSDAARIRAGSGLGLHIARKIALAHGGKLDLAPTAVDGEIAFRLAIPVSKESELAQSHSDRG